MWRSQRDARCWRSGQYRGSLCAVRVPAVALQGSARVGLARAACDSRSTHQLTSSYTDVAVNATVTVALLVVLFMLLRPDADHRTDIAIALAALGIATGSKLLMTPVALITWASIVVLAARSQWPRRESHRKTLLVALVIAGIVVLLPKVVSNMLLFGNPFYPIALDVGVLHFRGVENAGSPVILTQPAALTWLRSLAEFDAFRGRPLPWVVDQGDVPAGSPSFRMGGYFVTYVLGALVMLVWSVRSTRQALRALAVMITLTLLCMTLPNSYELRYYSFWMMTLACVMLAVAYSPLFATADQPWRRRAAHDSRNRGGDRRINDRRSVPAHGSMSDRRDLRQSNATIAQIPDGATLCIRNYDRRAILYAEIFHPERHYRVSTALGATSRMRRARFASRSPLTAQAAREASIDAGTCVLRSHRLTIIDPRGNVAWRTVAAGRRSSSRY